MGLTDSPFIKKYVKEMTSAMAKTFPNLSEETIKKTIVNRVKKDIQIPSVILDNNYTGECKESNLLSVFDWAIERKPIIAGNGTFYKPQSESMNPIANMLDGFLSTRKALKKQMFMIEDTSSWKYIDLDRDQLIEKINANSYYGSMGAKSSAFYSKYSGPATTGGAQSVISTAEQMFESFLVDNYLYLDVNELIDWLEHVVKDYKKQKIKIDDWVIPANIDDLVARLSKKIITNKFSDEEIIHRYLLSLDGDIITYIYYKNNLINFINVHPYVSNMFVDIVESVNPEKLERIDEHNGIVPEKYASEFTKQKDYNKFVDKLCFKDPNDVPDNIVDKVKALNNVLMKYVYIDYISFDKIYRLKNFKRNCVTVIDTDSNFLSLDTVMNFLINKILTGHDFGRTYLANIYILINTLTYTITECSTNIFLKYGEYINVDEQYRSRFNMKNEFLILRLIIAKTKKRYLSKIYLREGNELTKPKLDIKGFDFKKASCSEEAEEIFLSIIKKRLMSEGNIDPANLYKDILKFAEDVKNSIISNEKTFLPLASAKDMAAYADPSSEQSVRGVITWNILNPDNVIELPSKVNMIKLNTFTEESIEPLKKTNPLEYNLIMDNIFNDKTGIFVSYKEYPLYVDYVNPSDPKWIEKVPQKFRSKYKKKDPTEYNKFVEKYDGPNPRPIEERYALKKRGMQCIAIPSNGNIPDYLIPFIDINTMVNNIVAPFNSVLELFGFQPIEEGKSHGGVNRKSTKYSNVIKF